jgi:hypothetical protein
MAKSPPKGSTVPPRRKGAPPRGRAVPPPRPPRKKKPLKRPPRRNRWLLFGLPAAAIVVIVVLIVVLTSGGSGKGNGPNAANYTAPSGVKVYGAIGPEGVPLEVGPNLAPANNAGLTGAPVDGIQSAARESLVYHHHAHLAIFVNGQPRSVPLGIGMVPPVTVTQKGINGFAQSASAFYWMHTHAQDGIMHIETPQPKTYVLGQFFDLWGQPLSSTQVGPAKGTVTATVNGKAWTGDPKDIPLTQHADIVLNVGGPTVTPPAIDWGKNGL